MSKTIRLEEYHPVGALVMNRFGVDKADFIGFSPFYDGPFETEASAKIEAVLTIVGSRFHINKIRVISNSIKLMLGQTRPKLSLLEKYVMMAHSDINLTSKEFGFADLRDSLDREDVEAVETDFEFLIQNTENNILFLEPKGFTDVAFTAIKDLCSSIIAKNVEQESLKSDKRRAVAENHILFDDTLNLIKDLQDTGKRLYKFTNKEKTKDYTMSYTLDQLRIGERKAEEANNAIPNACLVDISVTDADGNPLDNIKATIVEYNLIAESDAEGCLLFEAVPTAPTTLVSIVLEGETWVTQTLTEQVLVANGQLSLDVVMVAEVCRV